MCSCPTALIMHMQKKRESCNVNHCAVNIATCTFECPCYTNTLKAQECTRVDRKYTRPYTQERVQFKCNFVEDTARWYSTQRNKLYKIAKYSIFAMLVRLFWECTWLWKSQKTLISDLSQSKKQMTQKCKIYIFCFARQTIHVIVMIKNDIEKKRNKIRKDNTVQNNLFR